MPRAPPVLPTALATGRCPFRSLPIRAPPQVFYSRMKKDDLVCLQSGQWVKCQVDAANETRCLFVACQVPTRVPSCVSFNGRRKVTCLPA